MGDRLGRRADGRRRLDDARLRVNDRARLVERLRMNVPAVLDQRLGDEVAAREDLGRRGEVAAAAARAGPGEIRRADRVAQELDQFQVQRGDDQGDVGLESHAPFKANGVYAPRASACCD